MNPPQVYMCYTSWTLLPPPSPYHPSGSSQCTSPKHPVSCIEPGLATRFIHDILRFNAILLNLPTLSLSHRVLTFLTKFFHSFWDLSTVFIIHTPFSSGSSNDILGQCNVDRWYRLRTLKNVNTVSEQSLCVSVYVCNVSCASYMSYVVLGWLEKAMATRSSVLAWTIPGSGEPGGLPSMGSHRVGHDWRDLAAAAAFFIVQLSYPYMTTRKTIHGTE